jgi:hypothetical protein
MCGSAALDLNHRGQNACEILSDCFMALMPIVKKMIQCHATFFGGTQFDQSPIPTDQTDGLEWRTLRSG